MKTEENAIVATTNDTQAMPSANLSDLRPLAIRAYNGTSFDPEKRAESTISQHQALLDEALENMPEDEKARYISNFRKLYSAYLSARTRLYSAMITGPARFPTARMQKYEDWAMNAYKRFETWKERADKAIERKIERNRPQDEVTAENWQAVEKDIFRTSAIIIGIMRGEVKGSDKSLFVSNFYGRMATIAFRGDVETTDKAVELVNKIIAETGVKWITARHSFFRLPEQARKMRAKIAELETRENEEHPITEDIKYIKNYSEDRLQIIFPGKPDADIRKFLHSHGFNWSGRNQAWQRKLTENAMYSLRNFIIPRLS